MLNNIPKKIKYVWQSDKFEDESHKNYYEHRAVKKRKQELMKKKSRNRQEFLEENEKFKSNLMNSEDVNFTDFDKYDLDPEKSFDFEDNVILLKMRKFYGVVIIKCDEKR